MRVIVVVWLGIAWAQAEAAVVEYYAPDIDHYFITAGATEQALIDTGVMGYWQRTGKQFEAGGPNAVCRFYGNTRTNPSTGAPFGPNSHFYTADPAECAELRSIFRADAPSWQFEGYDFSTSRASAGACSPATVPIWRAYNRGFAQGSASNHRYTADLAAYFETVARGWAPEGAAMCAPPPPAACSADELAALEGTMAGVLGSVSTDADFTLLLESFDGRQFRYSRGSSGPDTVYESASTSKWVTAAVILSLVDRGYLSLDSRPQEFIEFWRLPLDHPAQMLTLRHLLSFTSGFHEEPLCLNFPGADFATCVRSIFELNRDRRIPPGTQYYYASTHLQIAGLMALRARGLTTWSDLFEEFRSRTGLFPQGRFDLPSASNPRLAGGMHWTGEDYLAFLRALVQRGLLSDDMSARMMSSQRGSARVIYSPLLAGSGEDWAYGLGNWVECASPSYDCGARIARNSSPGAYGGYPFVDFLAGHFGIVARQGGLGSGVEGLAVARSIAGQAAAWALRRCH